MGGDSWFGSVVTAVMKRCGVHSTWIIKAESAVVTNEGTQCSDEGKVWSGACWSLGYFYKMEIYSSQTSSVRILSDKAGDCPRD